MGQFAEFTSNHLILMTMFTLVSIALIWNLTQDQAGGIPRLSPIEAVQLMNHEEAVVLDVRESGEYEQGHILGAEHIPLGSLSNHLKKLDKHKHKHVIVSCQSGARSLQACHTLKRNEFSHVYNLKGGVLVWYSA
jgi:rhodanese-related sulfurtransferase